MPEMTAASEWMAPGAAVAGEWYLVQTNGMEWRDSDLFIMRGAAIVARCRPEIVRGRPIRIARINLTEPRPE